jgi:hypothetical protein
MPQATPGPSAQAGPFFAPVFLKGRMIVGALAMLGKWSDFSVARYITLVIACSSEKSFKLLLLVRKMLRVDSALLCRASANCATPLDLLPTAAPNPGWPWKGYRPCWPLRPPTRSSGSCIAFTGMTLPDPDPFPWHTMIILNSTTGSTSRASRYIPPYRPSDVLFNVDLEAYRDSLADHEADVAAEDKAESIGEKMNKE